MAETISSQLPPWLAERAKGFTQSSTAQDIQLGAQMAQQFQQMKHENEKMQMLQEAQRLKMEGQKFIATGGIELGRLMEEGGLTDSYADPAFEGKLWSLGKRYPHLMDTDQFRGAVRVTENAKAAQSRTEITALTQDAITQRNQAAIESRFDLLSQRLEGMANLEGVKHEHRAAIAELQNDLKILQQSLKPTRPGEVFHDLSEKDTIAMRSELTGLDNEYNKGRIKDKGGGMFSKEPRVTAEEQYRRQKQEILSRYDAKRIGTPKPAEAAPSGKRVNVKSPDGKVGSIPEAQLQDALKQGYQVVE